MHGLVQIARTEGTVAEESRANRRLFFRLHRQREAELDVPGRRLELKVSDEELEKRRADWQQPPAKYGRGYGALYLQHITQANEGCDFDFLEAGEPVPEPEIH